MPEMQALNQPSSKVFLLRHAHAAWPNPGERDFDRRLDDAGYAQAEIIANKAAEKGYRPDVVLSSTAMRCRETAEAIRRAFNDTFDITYVDEIYNAPAETYLALLSAQSVNQSMMLVGHNPTMEAVLEALIGQSNMDAALSSGLPTAGLAVLDATPSQDVKDVKWHLVEFLVP